MSGLRRIFTKFAGTGSLAGSWIFRVSDGGLLFAFSDSTGTFRIALAPNVITVNEFQHVAATYDGSVIKLYRNGILVASNIVNAGLIPDLSQSLTIGEDNPVNIPEFFDGLIDEVEVFDRALSAQEIQAIFNANSAGKCKEDPAVVNLLTQFGLEENVIVGQPREVCVEAVKDVVVAPPVAVCGNGIIETGEQCDDGNTVSGDGCSATCQLEVVLPPCTIDQMKDLDGNGVVNINDAIIIMRNIVDLPVSVGTSKNCVAVNLIPS